MRKFAVWPFETVKKSPACCGCRFAAAAALRYAKTADIWLAKLPCFHAARLISLANRHPRDGCRYFQRVYVLSNFLRPLSALLLVLATTACDGAAQPYTSREVAVKGLFSAALSRDGTKLAVGSLTHGGSLWNVTDNERRFNWNHRTSALTPISCVAFSPDGKFAMTTSDATLVLWDAQSGAAITYFSAPGQVLAIDLGADGHYALVGLANHEMVLFDARLGGIKRVFHHEGRVYSVAFNDAAALALSGSEDHSARLWDVHSGVQLQRWDHVGEVRLVVLSPDGSRALTASKYDHTTLWDTGTGLELGELPQASFRIARGESPVAATFSTDSRLLLTGTMNRTVQLWEIPGLREIQRWAIPRRETWKRSGAYVLAVGFAGQSGDFLSVSSDGFIHSLRLSAQ